jgi:hypothetical protein
MTQIIDFRCRFGVFLALFLLVGAACVPATTPPQLGFTPGAPVVVTAGRIETEQFSVMRPDGWRVITSAADAPLTVIFVSPDDDALILLSTAGIGQPPSPTNIEPNTTLHDATEQVYINDLTVSVYTVAPSAQWDAIAEITQRVVGSLAAAR